MKKPTRWVGLDVHAETIAVAVAEEDGAVRSLGKIPNERTAIDRMLRKLGERQTLRFFVNTVGSKVTPPRTTSETRWT